MEKVKSETRVELEFTRPEDMNHGKDLSRKVDCLEGKPNGDCLSGSE